MIRLGWTVFRRDVRSVIPGRRIHTASVVGGVTTAVILALCAVGLLFWGWGGDHLGLTIAASVFFALGAGAIAFALCPLGPFLTGEHLLRDPGAARPPRRLGEYFGKQPIPIRPVDRDDVLDSAARQVVWAVMTVTRYTIIGVGIVLLAVGLMFLLFARVSTAVSLSYIPLYGLLSVGNAVAVLGNLGRVERTRLAALAVPDAVADDAPPPRRPGSGGSKLRLPGE